MKMDKETKRLIDGRFDQLIKHQSQLLEGMIARYMLMHGCSLRNIRLVEERRDDHTVCWYVEPLTEEDKVPLPPEEEAAES